MNLVNPDCLNKRKESSNTKTHKNGVHFTEKVIRHLFTQMTVVLSVIIVNLGKGVTTVF